MHKKIINNDIDKNNFSIKHIDRIIEMAWEDRTTFDAIKYQFNLSEQEVISLMRRELSVKGFKRWRKRVQGRKTKHLQLRNFSAGTFRCSRQKTISNNVLAKKK